MEVPPEVVAAVFEFLSERELLLSAALVCHRWRALALDPPLWRRRCLAFAAKGRKTSTSLGSSPEGAGIFLPVRAASERSRRDAPGDEGDGEVDWPECFGLMVRLRKALASNVVLLVSEEHKGRFIVDELSHGYGGTHGGEQQQQQQQQQQQVLVCDLAKVSRANETPVKRQFHAALKEAFRFPYYYGHNLDALNDSMRDAIKSDHRFVLANIPADVVTDPETRWSVVLRILNDLLDKRRESQPDTSTKLVLWFTPEAARLLGDHTGDSAALTEGKWA